MATTIQVSPELLKELALMKIHKKESYEEVIWDMVEDKKELSKETKKAIAEYEKDIKEGNVEKFTSHEDVKKELGLDV